MRRFGVILPLLQSVYKQMSMWITLLAMLLFVVIMGLILHNRQQRLCLLMDPEMVPNRAKSPLLAFTQDERNSLPILKKQYTPYYFCPNYNCRRSE